MLFLYISGQKHSFKFDRVFIPDVSQEDVFEDISQLVQSALDGYKVIKTLLGLSLSSFNDISCHLVPNCFIIILVVLKFFY